MNAGISQRGGVLDEEKNYRVDKERGKCFQNSPFFLISEVQKPWERFPKPFAEPEPCAWGIQGCCSFSSRHHGVGKPYWAHSTKAPAPNPIHCVKFEG